MPSTENKQELRPVIFGMPFDALTERETLDRTPVPGGVGPMTINTLIYQSVESGESLIK